MVHHPCKIKLTTNQKKQILDVKNSIVSQLKEYTEIDDTEDLADYLYKIGVVRFTIHASDRLSERFLQSSDSPFQKLGQFWDKDYQKEISTRSAVEVFLKSDTIGEKAHFGSSSYPRINYSLTGDKTILSIEIRNNEDGLIILTITVMKKNA